MKSLLTIILVFTSLSTAACIISPAQRLAMHTEQVFESSDIVFFGKLERIEQSNNEQKAYFTVIKVYKGSPKSEVSIINGYTSSCSRAFENIGTAYYVFAQDKLFSTSYKIPETSATFMSLQQAMDLEFKL